MARKKAPISRIDWKKHMTTVTPLSRGLAFILFIIIPFFTFLFGVWYGEAFTKAQMYSLGWKHKPTEFTRPYTPSTDPDPTPEQVACTMDAMVCPDGSYVGRQGPTCEFAPCPTQ